MRFISWNVNGIRAIAKKEALKWIDECDVDVLALQEIKAEASQIPSKLFQKRFENIAVSSSVPKKGLSGVATFFNFKADFVSKCYEVDILQEGRINEIHFNNIAFFNVYFPNGQRNQERLEYKLAFYERFFQYIQKLRQSGKSIIFCGDINTAHKEIDLARPKENENTSGFLEIERAWIDKLIENDYIDTFRYFHPDEANRYSWWSMRTRARERNVGWRIDYFFVSSDLKDKLISSDILDTIQGSDHAPVTLEIDLSS